MEKKYHFTFTALPKCMVTNRPTPADLELATSSGRMVFVIISTLPDERKLDLYIDGFLTGCGVSRSEYISIFYNDTGMTYEEAMEKFMEKYKTLKFPEAISGYTSLAKNKPINLLSAFLSPKAPGCEPAEEKK